ncbi:MAG: ribonuclease P protein component [Candidatus Berkelbacteria bacterium]|nr:ribonuclease P protein component [Candidatus Berkelbacteria bacterium]
MIKGQNRLRLSRHIKRAFEKGIAWQGAFFKVKAYRRRDFSDNPARLAVVAFKKVSSKAVNRNLIRRRLKAAFRDHLEKLSGWDIVVLSQGNVQTADFAKIQAEAEKCSSFLQSKQSGPTRKP